MAVVAPLETFLCWMHPWHPLTRDQWGAPPSSPSLAPAGSAASLALPLCNVHANIKSITGSCWQNCSRGTFPYVTCTHTHTHAHACNHAIFSHFWIPFVNEIWMDPTSLAASWGQLVLNNTPSDHYFLTIEQSPSAGSLCTANAVLTTERSTYWPRIGLPYGRCGSMRKKKDAHLPVSFQQIEDRAKNNWSFACVVNDGY